jgi:hypothetical protein
MLGDENESSGGGGSVVNCGGVGDGDRHARNLRLLRDLDALREESPDGYADALALLDDLEQRVRDRKK